MKKELAGIAAVFTFIIAIQSAHAQTDGQFGSYSWFTSAGFEGNAPAVPAAEAEVPKASAPAAKPPANPIGNFGVVLYQGGDARGGAGEGVVYRGGSLDNEASFEFLRDLGVSVVVSLQSINAEDEAFCAKYGFTCQRFGVFPFDFISLTRSSEFQEAFRFVLDQRKAGKKVYIHCMKGKDRTGALAAALMIREQACGGNADKVQLRDTIEKSLKAHRFWLRNYPKWHAEIIGWVDNFEGNKGWLCK